MEMNLLEADDLLEGLRAFDNQNRLGTAAGQAATIERRVSTLIARWNGLTALT